MNYPLISQYVEAIADAENSLDKLRHLRPVMDNYGSPTRSSGAFAVVFKMEDPATGRKYALKCFTEDQIGRADAYRAISEELQYVSGRYFCSMQYYENELFVDTGGDDTMFPVLLMDWVEGETMEQYISKKYRDSYAMSMLAYEFCKLASWLRSQSFAHGDIKPDNIIVRPDGSLTLIDYDGMYVSTMKGQKSPTLGTADFRHPERTDNDFDETIDDFTLASMALSLKAISVKPELANKYGTTDKILFSEDDYRDIAHSFVLKELLELLGDKELARLYALFLLAHSKKNLSSVSFRDFLIEKSNEFILEKPAEEVLSTEVTDQDLAEAVEDEYGVKYSKDGKRLLKAHWSLKNYIIRQGTKVICRSAFYDRSSLKAITFPDSLTTIGGYAFRECNSLKSITIPDGVTTIEEDAFRGCKSLESITLPSSLRNINGNPFKGLKLKIVNHSPWFYVQDDILYSADKKKLISCVSSEKKIVIPNGETTRREWAFGDCSSFKFVDIPDDLTTIGECAFGECASLLFVDLPDGVTTIEKGAFSGCYRLSYVYLPNSLTMIGGNAFRECKSLKSITIPDGVTTIENADFTSCSSLESIIFPDGLTMIGGNAFRECKSLKSITIPDGVTTIEEDAFYRCESLESITLPSSLRNINGNPFKGLKLKIVNHSPCFHVQDDILYSADKKKLISCVSSNEEIVIPDGVTTIGELAFCKCKSFKSIKLPDSLTEIGERVFGYCASLESISIPDSVTMIEKCTFYGCESLETITIPDGVITIGELAFCKCKSFKSIKLPDSLTEIGKAAFEDCISLETITIPDGVTTIGNYAFCKCRSLKSITLPSSLRNINGNPFPGLRLNIVNHSPYFHMQDGILYTADKKKLIFCVSSYENIVIPDGVITIGDTAFSDCDSIKSIKIPKSVISVENGAFGGCSSLKSITIPNKEAKMDNCGLCTRCNLDEETIKELRKRCKKNDIINYGTKK